jgi:hypothetical protein
MNARSVEDDLDRLAPREQFAHDWNEVLERAGVQKAGAVGPAWRRLKWLLLAAVVAAVVVPIAAATVAVTNWSGWFSSSPDQFRPASEPVVVRTGSWDGTRWQLVAYLEFHTSNVDLYCYSVMPYGSSLTARPDAVGCGGIAPFAPGASPDHNGIRHAGILYGATESPGLPYWAAAPVVDTAVEVALHFRDGDVLRVPTYAAPESLGHVRFYATPIPDVPQSSGQSPVKVVGLDENGAVVACLAVDPGSASC